MDKDLINQPSYYPERSFHKTKLSVFFDQLLEILKYGAPEAGDSPKTYKYE